MQKQLLEKENCVNGGDGEWPRGPKDCLPCRVIQLNKTVIIDHFINRALINRSLASIINL